MTGAHEFCWRQFELVIYLFIEASSMRSEFLAQQVHAVNIQAEHLVSCAALTRKHVADIEFHQMYTHVLNTWTDQTRSDDRGRFSSFLCKRCSHLFTLDRPRLWSNEYVRVTHVTRSSSQALCLDLKYQNL